MVINKNRQLDKAIFFLNSEVNVSGYTVKYGWNKLLRIDDMYRLSRLDDSEQHFVPVSLGPVIMERTTHWDDEEV